eukprot:1824886-Amphidinium_carterae.1
MCKHKGTDIGIANHGLPQKRGHVAAKVHVEDGMVMLLQLVVHFPEPRVGKADLVALVVNLATHPRAAEVKLACRSVFCSRAAATHNFCRPSVLGEGFQHLCISSSLGCFLAREAIPGLAVP